METVILTSSKFWQNLKAQLLFNVELRMSVRLAIELSDN